MRGRLWFYFSLVAILGCGCVGPKQGLFPADGSKTVYVVHRGMHAALVVHREDIPAGVWPSHLAAPAKQFIEMGWGDNEGYRFPWTSRIVVRALFWPTPSVIYMNSFDKPVTEHFSDVAEEIIELNLSDAGFARMCAYFQRYYRLNDSGQPVALGNDFYAARESYHAFQNSNHWAARALREAGCPITSFYAITAHNVMFQSRRFGRVIWGR
jgi:hypothetical protein